jgi:hypothetical protein
MRFSRSALYVSVFLGLLSPASGETVNSAPRAIAPSAAPVDALFPCVPDATTLCLNHGRFEVTANFAVSSTLAGDALVVALTDDTGYLWFFSSDNVEIVVKVLDGCGLNGHYWVFAGGLTNVDVCLRVTDSQNAGFTLYCNRPGTPFQPIQDTSAFSTCP